MQSPATSAASTAESTPLVSPASTPATSEHSYEHGATPDFCPTKRPTRPTQDFYLDTFFNPVWTYGMHVFAFSPDGTVVRPDTYATEPYPGYHADHARALRADAALRRGSRVQGRDPKPWKNVAITEQDDAEWEEMRERMRIGAVGERGRYAAYYRSLAAGMVAQCATPEQPEYVYTWPPKPCEE